MTTKAMSQRLTALLMGATLSCACAAQDDSHSREREALRRTQAALRQSQEQQATLSKEKDDLAAQRDKLDDAAKRAQSQLASTRSDAGRLNASLAQVEEELAAVKARDDAARKDLEARLSDQMQRLAEAQRVADERARSNAALSALLEQSTRSLAAAEMANQQMHALGLQLIDRVRGRDGGLTVGDPVLGFNQIRLENEAESLRDKIDAARIRGATPAAAGGE